MSQPYQTHQQSQYSQGGPVQHPMSTPQYPLPQQPVLTSIRPSSGAWNPSDDQTLMTARAQGMNWAPIQQQFFPNKTPNACRKRHERLMEKRSADDWDGMKLESMASKYMAMRREIWAPLAAQTGEKWSVVEQKCMSQGLKNLQTAARSHARHERMLSTSHSLPQQSHSSHSHHPSHSSLLPGNNYSADDSGISIEDLEAEYDANHDHDGHSERSSSSVYGGHGGGHYHSHSGGSGVGSLDGRGYSMQGQGGQGSGQQGRLPSMDMGIDAIINRPGGNGR
ncbi:hypothetical protein BGZ60DRAFT_474622 [Tricladium varicosporioides]|nr:hypothetical protein BGZ60DRAFT_474622 [Hymenoscyphus varicosporioides]